MVKLIAEVCQNHQGSRALLGEMIAAAAESGADYVKMQSIFAEDLTRRECFEEGETAPDGTVRVIRRPYEAERARLRSLDLTEEDHLFFIGECQKRGVTPMTTVFARRRIPFVASLPWTERVIKVASYDCASFPMLRELCERFDHLIVSTGATFDDEIAEAARVVKDAGKKLTFLHCVTSYPNTLDMCNLARMEWLRNLLHEEGFAAEGLPDSRSSPLASVGWSDHTLVERDGLRAAKAAIALGAQWIERHFTILEKDRTKDGPVSIRPEHLQELRAFSRLPREEQLRRAQEEVLDWDAIVGQPIRSLTHIELVNRDYYRGRFASRVGDAWIQNWEERDVFSSAMTAHA